MRSDPDAPLVAEVGERSSARWLSAGMDGAVICTVSLSGRIFGAAPLQPRCSAWRESTRRLIGETRAASPLDPGWVRA